mmetsp:Transcript_76018/g.158536  ORF Transcript_76018/g.158536 Transcript_76018/m.158536 type:complete len:120 (+) Transcript_76018:435-794(+)|eukprot:CAMPEP_0206479660 /NCGR_PEP_ID=MMETSP0324_2-20121206/36806_1 /ASSEMBLY_ACC=CAM_ASM_000836 /TAXON_ID=2866 /ORGANISM="Crypthecodinium cohnii, Strain Seligo" /LENGTH=119 /DNA_ID=CAMNT_0053956249 /DNA_START=391 /DNA_END=750 /DNA_ORIENTATION=+
MRADGMGVGVGVGVAAAAAAAAAEVPVMAAAKAAAAARAVSCELLVAAEGSCSRGSGVDAVVVEPSVAGLADRIVGKLASSCSWARLPWHMALHKSQSPITGMDHITSRFEFSRVITET